MRSLLIYFIAVLFLVAAVACGDRIEENAESGPVDSHLAYLLADLRPDNAYDNPGVTAPDDGCTRIRIRNIGGPFGKVFNDSNYRHIELARAGGMEPFETPEEAWRQGKGLVRVFSDEYLYIDSLTHSYPYLRPHAAALLEEVGRRFADSLDARGGGAYRLKVTSLLRSDLTIGKLRRVNRNAIPESAHNFGTTFDISYSKFICDNADGTRRTFEDLKNLLAEVVFALRSEGRCLVKHERHQACFHITAAPDSTTRL